ncbi:preprotein translocase subunit SecG [Methylobacter sp. YRD-M1]|uniref:preprotein translocase subunit SecG n=1 Tax=Methylobacter sp. YRD-M1 TaxID=2911520 RepID=UPI00227C5046|nr:preprotein translocase subunit SecG [Methylobacter sp. YRD-M1]WAK03748.1 preprotein translocase subunit SecG [Methylobacter sp. YRD-M1]
MYQVIIVVHVLLGIGVVGLVLMQQGKGADAGAAFGSGSSGSVFGAQGAASFLSRATAILATLFFTTSLGLAVLSGQQGKTTDLMSTPEAEDTSGIPKVDGATDMKSVPAIPEAGSEKAPVAPAPVPAEKPVDQTKDKVEK